MRWFLIAFCLAYGIFELAYAIFRDDPMMPRGALLTAAAVFFALAWLLWMIGE